MTDLVDRFCDYLRANPDALRQYKGSNGYVIVGARFLLHRVVTQAPAGVEVDHINRDPSDNRPENLRLATRSQNMHSARTTKRGGAQSSIHRGVCLHRSRKGDSTTRWRAHIGVDGRTRHLGYFQDEREAALAYDAAARRLHGAFAVVNFPAEAS